jgi:hypothetical protein
MTNTMKKTTSFGLAAILLAGVFAVPAIAASDFDDDFLVKQLQQRGVNATDVYEHGDNVIRADVKQADGSTIFQYFYEDTLQQVKPASETRVLTQVDRGVVRSAPTPSTESLLYDGDGDNI